MEKLDIVILGLLSASIAVMTLCGLVLFRGGFYAIGQYNRKINKMLRFSSFYAFATTTMLLCYFCYSYLMDEHDQRVMRVLDTCSYILIGATPMFAFVFKQVNLRLKHWLRWLLPYVPMLVASMTISQSSPKLFFVIEVATYIYMVGSILHTLCDLRCWDKKIQDLYSNTVCKQTKWFRNLVLPFLLIAIYWLPTGWWPQSEIIDVFYYLTLMAVFVRFTSFALQQEEYEVEQDVDISDDKMETQQSYQEQKSDVEVKAPSQNEEYPAWTQKLEKVVREEHVYRQEDLTRNDLADMILVNRTYITEYLKNSYGQTFNEYINKQRLAECKELLLNSDMEMSDIATQCGFRNRRSMYRVFLNEYGISPTDWVKREKGKLS